MKLPPAAVDLQTALQEFDIWITPSLGEITDTEKFKTELEAISNAFELLGNATDQFTTPESFCRESLADFLVDLLSEMSPDERRNILNSIAAALFIATGKSGNNFKCQFPLFIRDQLNWSSFPKIRQRNNKKEIVPSDLPRVIESGSYMTLISEIEDKDLQAKLLGAIISFLLNDKSAESQLWSVGYSYFALKKFERSRDLLAPLVIFKIRGSVTASGGHEPEEILRRYLIEWGLRPGVDFNIEDVVVVPSTGKTRAFDFVLPYKTPDWPDPWEQRIFIQCQFYAGDSGSVSHKNVDQARSTKEVALQHVPDAVFLEYVDGAGYFSSLNGDLKRLLGDNNTKSFFQIRSAPIRLRRELQELGFITPLEIEHALVSSSGTEEQVFSALSKMGYRDEEIERAWRDAQSRNFAVPGSGTRYTISNNRREVVRRVTV